jgi:CYTH domain-containing protein
MTERGSSVPKESAQPPLEIERKFLVDNLPYSIMLDRLKSYDIVQGYLVISADGAEVRLRKKGEKYLQTFKSGGNKTRTEVEIEIGKDQFEALWPLTEGKRVEKTRYEYPYVGDLIEIDIYRGQLEGLITAEVEFESEDASTNFRPPIYMEREITDDKRYKNQNLALHGLPS